jgi:hypothetical protein
MPGLALLLVIFVLSGLLIVGCASTRLAKTSITTFMFTAADNSVFARDSVGYIDHKTKIITVVVPPGADVSSLVATFVAPEKGTVYVKQASGAITPQTNGVTPNDFSRPVTYVLVLEDGTEVEYIIKIREAETNAALSALALGDEVVFSPAFSTKTESYSAEVPFSIAAIKIRPTAESQYASISIGGGQYRARGAQASVPLKAGEVNAISILVTAEDGETTRTYTLNIKRGEPDHDATLSALVLGDEVTFSPAFSTDVESYSAEVPFTTGAVNIHPAATHQQASITIAGGRYGARDAEVSVPLNAGEVNAIPIVVTAEDGETTRTYTLNIKRGEPDHDATLSALTVSEEASLSPVFSGETTSYTARIPYDVSSMTITPVVNSPVAVVAVNGKAIESGSAVETVMPEEDTSAALTITVTAQDGKTVVTYSVEVIRNPIDPTWSQAVARAGFQGRFGFAAVVFKSKIWVIGGSSTNLDYLNDIWYSTDGSNWTRATENPGFSPRRSHQVVVFKGKLWLLGGESGAYEYERDVWTSKDGVYWVKLEVVDPFPKRANYQVIVFNNKMWVIGGHESESDTHTIWSSTDGVHWIEEVHEAAFPPRDMHQVVVHNGRMWVLGGRHDSERLSDVWSSKDGIEWTLVADSSETGFPSRMLHEASVFAGRIWISGGYVDGYNPVNDVWYSRDGKTWKMAVDSAEFTPRVSHQIAVFKGKLWIIGGISKESSLGDVWFSNASEKPPADKTK